MQFTSAQSRKSLDIAGAHPRCEVDRIIHSAEISHCPSYLIVEKRHFRWE